MLDLMAVKTACLCEFANILKFLGVIMNKFVEQVSLNYYLWQGGNVLPPSISFLCEKFPSDFCDTL